MCIRDSVINVGDKVELVRRESNTVNVQTLMHCTHIKTDTTLARKLSELEIIDEEWRLKCFKIANKGDHAG